MRGRAWLQWVHPALPCAKIRIVRKSLGSLANNVNSLRLFLYNPERAGCRMDPDVNSNDREVLRYFTNLRNPSKCVGLIGLRCYGAFVRNAKYNRIRFLLTLHNEVGGGLHNANLGIGNYQGGAIANVLVK